MAEHGNFVTSTASRRNERQHGQQVSKGGRGGEQDAHGTPQRDVAAMSSAARRRRRTSAGSGQATTGPDGPRVRPTTLGRSVLGPRQPVPAGRRRDMLGGTEWFCPVPGLSNELHRGAASVEGESVCVGDGGHSLHVDLVERRAHLSAHARSTYLG